MKNMTVERVDVWAAGIKDEPGGLANVLDELRTVGADFDFVLARRDPDQPGSGVVFVAPLRSDAEVSAASTAGFDVTTSVHSVRVEGNNAPGIAATVAEKLGAAGINMRGLSAGSVGQRFILYIGFDSEADADQAVAALNEG
jgi:hypothetical protein